MKVRKPAGLLHHFRGAVKMHPQLPVSGLRDIAMVGGAAKTQALMARRRPQTGEVCCALLARVKTALRQLRVSLDVW